MERNVIDDIIKSMNWSFSRLNGFYGCKRSWYIQYILNKYYAEKYQRNIKKIDKFFGMFGSFAHKVFEKYNKGELYLFELYDYCNNNYETEIPVSAPPNKYVDLYNSYRAKLLDYFLNFDGDSLNVIESEFELKLEIILDDGEVINFNGFIDLILQDENSDLIIKDYKSKSDFKSKEEYSEYLRQLLLYSLGVKKVYGKYPKKLIFDMFKINKVYEKEFDENDLKESITWMTKTISEIRKEEKFEKRCENPNSDFFCRYVCSFGTEVCNQVENDECVELEEVIDNR